MSNVNSIDMARAEKSISFTLDMFYKNSFAKLKTCEYMGEHVLKGENGDMPVEITLIMEVRQK